MKQKSITVKSQSELDKLEKIINKIVFLYNVKKHIAYKILIDEAEKVFSNKIKNN